MSRLGRILLVISIAVLGPAVALPAGAPAAKKKKKAPTAKVKVVGFAVVPVSIADLTDVPPIPKVLTKAGGTITDCGGAVPNATPTGGNFAGLVVVTSVTSGRPYSVEGNVAGPDKIQPVTFGLRKPNSVASFGGQIPLLSANGAYKLTIRIIVRSGPRKFKKLKNVTANLTVSCPGSAGASASATKPKKKKKKKKVAKKKPVIVGKLSVLGFRVVATPKDGLTEIPPIPLTLTGSRGTISNCGSAYPLPVPTDDLWATLVIATSVAGKADVVQGTLTDPDGDSVALMFGTTSGAATAVVAGTGALPILTKNGTFTVTATPSVKTGTKSFKSGATLTRTITIACSRP